MENSAPSALTWRQGVRTLAGHWRPLVIYELAISLVLASTLSPLALALSYRLIEFSGEPALGNQDLAWFFLSPIGLPAFILGAAVILALTFVEYAGLILLAAAALRRQPLTLMALVGRLIEAAPRLLGLAAMFVVAGLAVVAPFAGLAAIAYAALLGDADINYFLTERPPRYWVAVAIASVLATGLAASLGYLAVRWAFALPVCVLQRRAWLDAVRTSWRATRGRVRRLFALFTAWWLLQNALLALTVAGLDWLHPQAMPGDEEPIAELVWTTVGWLLFDAALLQVISAVATIALAALIAYEYERARRTDPLLGTAPSSPQPAAIDLNAKAAWPATAALGFVVLAAPTATLLYLLAAGDDLVDNRPTMVTAHRAGPKTLPENSIAALRESIEIGADYVEIDVQQTADGEVVLLHDRDLRRVTGDPRVLNEVPLADLAELRIRTTSGPTEEPIPTLAEFLAACGDAMRVNVELKDYGQTPDLSLAVLEVLRKTDFTARAVSSSFSLPQLTRLHEAEPKVPVGMILTASRGDMTRLPVQFLSLNLRLARAPVVRGAHAAGMEIHVWGVNDREAVLRCLDLGCDNLITSYPAMVRQVVDDYAELSDAERMVLRLRRWMRD